MNKPRIVRRVQDSGASGFADIAFMLLFFFLVTTQIEEEKGVRSEMPPIEAVAGPSARTIKNIMVNASDQILLDSELIDVEDLQPRLYEIMNREGYQNVSFVLKNSDATSYAVYLNIYSCLKGAYKDIRNDYARTHYRKSYHDVPQNIQKQIEREIPVRIAEANL